MSSVFGALGGAFGGLFAGGGAAAGGAAAGGAALSGSSLLFGGLSVGSALMSIDAVRQVALRRQSVSPFLMAEVEVAVTRPVQELAQGAARRANLAADYAQLVGEQVATQAAAGINPFVGSPRSVRVADADRVGRDLDTLRRNARQRAQAQRFRARGLLIQAGQERTAGRMARTEGVIRGGSQLLDAWRTLA